MATIGRLIYFAIYPIIAVVWDSLFSTAQKWYVYIVPLLSYYNKL